MFSQRKAPPKCWLQEYWYMLNSFFFSFLLLFILCCRLPSYTELFNSIDFSLLVNVCAVHNIRGIYEPEDV